MGRLLHSFTVLIRFLMGENAEGKIATEVISIFQFTPLEILHFLMGPDPAFL